MDVYQGSWTRRLFHGAWERLAYGKRATLGGTKLTCDEHTLAGCNTRINLTDILLLDIYYFRSDWATANLWVVARLLTLVVRFGEPVWMIVVALEALLAVLYALPRTQLVIVTADSRRRIKFTVWGDCTNLPTFVTDCEGKRVAALLYKLRKQKRCRRTL